MRILPVEKETISSESAVKHAKIREKRTLSAGGIHAYTSWADNIIIKSGMTYKHIHK